MSAQLTEPLITASALMTLLQSSQEVLVIDARFRLEDTAYGRRAFGAGHIPGAVYLHLDDDLSSPVIPGVTGRHPLPDPAVLEAKLRELGLRRDMPVVVYDDGPGFFAARAWWLLHWLGHPAVQVLDGGLAAWNQAGQPLTTDVAVKAWPGDFVARINPDMVIGAEDVSRQLRNQGVCLLDARAPERFRGEVEPIDPVAGHIPGAICVPCSGNLDVNGRFLSPEQLRARFPETDQPLVCYCGSGVTACHNILAALISGLPLPILYAGSWSEWITDINRPIEKNSQS